MQRKFSKIISVLLLILFASLAGSCGSSTDSVSEGGDDDSAALPPIASLYRGDSGYLQITVTSPSYLYLSGPEPLVVNLPQTKAFTWEDTRAKLTTPVFPMLIPFKVPSTAPGGRHDLALGLKIMYCNKADDICVFKNDLLNAPIEILPGARQGGPDNAASISVEYEIKEKERNDK